MRVVCAIVLLWASLAPAQLRPTTELAANASIAPVIDSSSHGPAMAALAPAMVAAAMPAAPAISPVKSAPLTARPPASWWALAAAQHAAVGFDSWSTRYSLSNGGRELDPLMRPFANSSALYPVMQTGPVALDYVALRMMRSHNRWMRRMWWVPQAALATGSVISGVHNIGVANRLQR